MRTTMLFACLLVFSCGDDDGATDASTRDATASDAPLVDSSERDAPEADALNDVPADDAAADAPVIGDAGDDAPMRDAGDDAPPQDAGDDAPAGGPCDGTRMGAACETSEDCGDLDCAEGTCFPSFAHAGGCGGFVGALCAVPDHPFCAYRTGASAGPCLNAAERDCACSVFSDDFVCF